MASLAETHCPGRARSPFAARVATAWLALALPLLVMMPACARLFGSGRFAQTEAAQQSALHVRLDLAERLLVAQLENVRSDLLLIGATSAVGRYLREDAADTAAVSNDLREFAATRGWCKRILLAVAGRETVSAERAGGKPACDPLLAIAVGVSPGTMLLDRMSGPEGPGVRLCFALPLEDGAAGTAALVAEGDPAILFADVMALSVGDGGPFLADGHGRWLLETPSPSVPLVRRGVGLSSWQGPAGGRWEIAVPGPDPARDTGATAPARQWIFPIVSLAGLVALVIVRAGEWRRRQRARIERCDPCSQEVR